MGVGPADLDGPDAFALLLRRYRRVAGLSQQQLAEAAGLGVRTLRDLERGRVTRPQQGTVGSLAEALKLTPAQAVQLYRAALTPRRGTGPAADDDSRVGATTSSVSGGPDAVLAALEPPPRVPLPADPPDFSGRCTELDRLAGRTPPPGVPVVVNGPPGIGKTTVIVRAARKMAAALPDGAFFVDLRGTQDRPLPIRSALAQLLAELGVDRRRLPGGLADRLALYHQATTDRAAVLVLDDAQDAAQVQPLLPVGAGWRVLVSSRRQLADLAAAERISLGALPDRDARELLVGVVGQARLAAEPVAVDELVGICGGLPLALRIAASRLASRPLWTVSGLMDRLRDSRRRLDGLYAGDVEVRSAFTVSYRQLEPDQRTAFRRLALLPWPGYDLATVADLLDTDLDRARVVLAGLADASLLTPMPVGDRFRLHDLLTVFGQERAADEDSDADREAAIDRVRAGLLATVAAAGTWFPSVREPLIRHRFTASRQRFESASSALDWFTSQRRAITWALRRTAEHQRHSEIVTVVEAVRGVANRHHHLAPWQDVFRLAVEAARALADPAAEARHRDSLGFALKYQVRRPAEALPEHERARLLHASVGDQVGYAWSTLYTTGALHRCGRLSEALDRARLAMSLFTELDDVPGRNIASYAIGDILRDLGRPVEAAETHRRGLEHLAEQGGRDRVTAGMFGYRLGLDLAAAGDLPGAVRVLDRALATFVAEHHPTGTAECLSALSEVLANLGSPRAVPVATQAVGISHELGDPLREAQAWYALGLVARAEGRTEDHLRCWQRSLSLCEGLTDLEGRSLIARLAPG